MQHRTLHLPDDVDQMIADIASDRKVSFAQVAREFIIEGMQHGNGARSASIDNNITTSQPNSINHDFYEKIFAATLENLLLTRSLAKQITGDDSLVINANRDAATRLEGEMKH